MTHRTTRVGTAWWPLLCPDGGRRVAQQPGVGGGRGNWALRVLVFPEPLERRSLGPYGQGVLPSSSPKVWGRCQGGGLSRGLTASGCSYRNCITSRRPSFPEVTTAWPRAELTEKGQATQDPRWGTPEGRQAPSPQPPRDTHAHPPAPHPPCPDQLVPLSNKPYGAFGVGPPHSPHGRPGDTCQRLLGTGEDTEAQNGAVA